MKTGERVWGILSNFLKRRLSDLDWNDVKTRKEHTESFEKGINSWLSLPFYENSKSFFLRGNLLLLAGVKLEG